MPFELPPIPDDRPILIAGPTASGKSALALELANRTGRRIVNADAIQVYDNWRVLTARPSPQDQATARHSLYGHVSKLQPYSVGAWLRDVDILLEDCPGPIIVGGTGLYFTGLTRGLAPIPETPPEVRRKADRRLAEEGPHGLLAELDPQTSAKIDIRNPVRVQRAWEVLEATGRGLAEWQANTPPPRLALEDCHPLVLEAPVDWLNKRIVTRFDAMLAEGALEEARENLRDWDPKRPSSQAIGAPELIAYLRGETTLEQARLTSTVATTRYAKRQRTWFRNQMRGWPRLHQKA